jgi:toxin YoeB
MRSLVFEGDTWSAYEQLRQSDKKLHENLCKILKEMLRGDPKTGLRRPEPFKHNLSGLKSIRLLQIDRIIYIESFISNVAYAMLQAKNISLNYKTFIV